MTPAKKRTVKKEVEKVENVKEVEPVAVEQLPKKEQEEIKVVVNQLTTDNRGDLKLSRQQIELIKKTIAQGASDDELMLFLNICKTAQLNPFLHHAHSVPFWDSKSGTEKRVVIIGIDGFRSIAESTNKYAGSDDAIFDGEAEVTTDVYEGKGKDRKKTGSKVLKVPNKATVSVYKVVEGQRYPFTASARWGEYFPTKKPGKWVDMPFLMLGKCAEVLALRKAFPKVLSGMYTPEEMDQAKQEGGEQKRQATGFDKLMKFAESASVAELEEFKGKIKSSDKYTEEQKKQFIDFADKRIGAIE